MWTRAELKSRAKDVLASSYWKAFAISLAIAFVGGGNGFDFRWGIGGGGGASSFDSHFSIWNNYSIFFATIILILAFFAFLIALAFRVLLGYPLEVGGRKYFTQSALNNIDMNFIGYAFKKDIYKDIVITMLYKGVLNFLWYLLLIIPGIVKYYAYSMVPYILGDNPNIGHKRAVELSKEMTYGHKFNMWILDLSFIGWYILGFIAFFVGVLFVMPYENATKAELYLILKQNAIENNYTTQDELR